jgi:hypothetical protein
MTDDRRKQAGRKAVETKGRKGLRDAAMKAVETKGPSERSRISKMAWWTMKNGKNDALNPFSKKNINPQPARD